jgi:hypothetical protein
MSPIFDTRVKSAYSAKPGGPGIDRIYKQSSMTLKTWGVGHDTVHHVNNGFNVVQLFLLYESSRSILKKVFLGTFFSIFFLKVLKWLIKVVFFKNKKLMQNCSWKLFFYFFPCWRYYSRYNEQGKDLLFIYFFVEEE